MVLGISHKTFIYLYFLSLSWYSMHVSMKAMALIYTMKFNIGGGNKPIKAKKEI